MSRVVINFSTGHYRVGQMRLLNAIRGQDVDVSVNENDAFPRGWPSHQERPYAFKAYSLHATSIAYRQLLWCDACIIPLRSLEPIWAHAKEHGVWMCANYGFSNYTWTADSAYLDLFYGWKDCFKGEPTSDSKLRDINRMIPHAIATAFALDLEHPKGRAFLDEYYRLASETQAFCGPWTNGPATPDGRTAPCGPPDVKGHRHDQTAASVIAWRLGIQLAEPILFSYKGGETEETILLAAGDY